MSLLIKNAAQIATPTGNAGVAGKAMGTLATYEDHSILIESGLIVAIAPFSELEGRIDASTEIIDASGKCVLPGFVDSHTHLVFGGYREEEYDWRLRGLSYMEIMKRGGGIVRSTEGTRAATEEALYGDALERLNRMLRFGVTTVEAKSGYGLDLDTEMKQLRVARAADQAHPVDVVSTFLGAHARPADRKEDPDGFIDFMNDQVLPAVAESGLAEFVDIFCEEGVFDKEQSRRHLERAKQLGFKLKMHADEIVPLGGAELAAELGCVSADHLLQASDAGVDAMIDQDVVATLLPLTAFSLKEPYARGRFMIDRGAKVALASDFNPGSFHSESIPLLVALATLYMNMTTEETITALTLNGAAALDRADRIGSIEVGKEADLVILRYPNYRFLPYHFGVNTVERVIKAGRLVVDERDQSPLGQE